MEIVVDFHLRPYYGDEHETDGLYYNEAKRGTTAFHAYATLYARVRNKRYTLAVRRVTLGDTASDVLAEFLGLVDDFDFEVKAVYVDSEFYDGNCLTLIQAHNHAYVMPIIKWGTKIQRELSDGWSREIEHDLTTEYGDHEWTVEFPVIRVIADFDDQYRSDATAFVRGTSDSHSCSMERTFGTARSSSKQAT